jgi:hypothetical protein
MRREITLLRIELEQLRAREIEARKAKEFLLAHIDRIAESRDHWRREAEDLSALIAKAPWMTREKTPNKPSPWSLLWWREVR